MKEVHDNFLTVEKGIEDLASDISSMNSKVEMVYDANNTIAQNISTLSSDSDSASAGLQASQK